MLTLLFPFTVNGILSSSATTNPHWYDANHVFIPYCSSDIWSGNAQAPPNQMAFLGSRIIDEVIKELLKTPSYRFADAKFVLLAGSSAGAAGVMINLDRVAGMIAASGSRADVRGLADSGWILENDYLESKQTEKEKPQAQQVAQALNKFMASSPLCQGDGKDGGGGEMASNCSPMESIRGAFK